MSQFSQALFVLCRTGRVVGPSRWCCDTFTNFNKIHVFVFFVQLFLPFHRVQSPFMHNKPAVTQHAIHLSFSYPCLLPRPLIPAVNYLRLAFASTTCTNVKLHGENKLLLRSCRSLALLFLYLSRRFDRAVHIIFNFLQSASYSFHLSHNLTIYC
jgi:hypothetical protein